MFTIKEKDQNTALLMVIGLKILWIEEVREGTRWRKQSGLKHKDPEGRKAKGRNDAENCSKCVCVCVCA